MTVTVASPASETTNCTVDMEYEPSAKNTKAFEALAADRLPDGHVPREDWPGELDYIAEDGTIAKNHMIPMFPMPQGFRDAMAQIRGELRWAADQVIGTLRWRTRTVGPLHPFSSRGMQWSFDGNTWFPMPSDTTLEIVADTRLALNEETGGEIQALLDAGEHEPLAHELLREALNLISSNPRSALLIGITALEVGIKQHMVACVPSTEWLAEEMPSPPVLKMLKSYLPKLSTPGGTATQPPDKAHEEALIVGVTLRNKLTHVGQDVTHDRVQKTLRAVRDVLWQLDLARGHAWAAAHAYPSLDEDFAHGARRV